MAEKPYAPLTLQQRIDSYTAQMKEAEAKAERAHADMLAAYDELMLVEAEVANKAPGWDHTTLSGLVPEGTNKYLGGTAVDPDPDLLHQPPPPPVESMEAPTHPAPIEDPKPI